MELPATSQQKLNVSRLKRRTRFFIIGSFAVILATVLSFVIAEMMTSKRQARYLHNMARDLTYKVEPGQNPAMHFPKTGPYDERLGYAHLPSFLQSLTNKGFVIEAQARLSPSMRSLINQDIFPIYKEKTQAGLQVLDKNNQEIFSARFPERVYEKFESIPKPVVEALLFIENRELLDQTYPNKNPAVEWDRLFRIASDAALSVFINDEQRLAGGSTLATQIEKYRHSPEGRTASTREKFRQMASASLRAYLDGETTYKSRHKIILDYVNSVPLAARAGYGEVNGIGDGMWVWYRSDFNTTNHLLRSNPVPGSAEEAARAVVYKQVLSLFLSQRRPSYYLLQSREALEQLTNTYLHLMTKEGVISAKLRDLALPVKLDFTINKNARPPNSFLEGKAANVIRSRLIYLLGLPRLYDLDRLDLTVESTLDGQAQAAVTQVLASLKDPVFAKSAGLYAHRLLSEDNDLSKIIYSFTLMEKTPNGNVVRVQTDNYDQPFDINAGVKLDLGSSAKLRTMVTYLDVISALYKRLSPLSREELNSMEVDSADHLTKWAIDYLSVSNDRSMLAMLNASLDRQYSANPHESFFTGGGLHTFANFQKEDDSKVVNVREALRESINLVFVRMMRDIVRYHMFQVPGSTAKILEDTKDARRPVYLSRFADREGSAFIQRFYRKYKGKSTKDAIELLIAGTRPTPPRVATIFLSVHSQTNFDEFAQFVRARLANLNLHDEEIKRLYTQYAPGKYSLPDRGFIAKVHPLELWTVSYLSTHPDAKLSEVIGASVNERQVVYSWLFKTRYKNAQDSRIRYLLEIEAFLEIHKEWKRLGYPFDSLVPSYATSIGSSADRPAALAELMGILVNGGIRYPTVRVEKLHFAAHTPYESLVRYKPSGGERVLDPEVTEVARDALLGVVAAGTARRVYKSFTALDGSEIPVGGKTGTGDHRHDTYGAGGKVIASRAVNRAATFVFYIGDRFFGNVTAFVPGEEADKYHFTSALPVQVLKTIAPLLAPLINSPTAPTFSVQATAETPNGAIPVIELD